jgi:hypothetical protein
LLTQSRSHPVQACTRQLNLHYHENLNH